MLFDPQVSGISTAASPVMSPICPLSQESTEGLTFTTLTSPCSSSSPATPADRQNRRGTRRSNSLVPSISMSCKRARMGNDSMNLGLHLDDTSTTPSTRVYDKFLDDDAEVEADLGPTGDGSGSQPQGHLHPALQARVDRYVKERVAEAVEHVVARLEGKIDALQSRVDQLETAQKQKNREPPVVKRSSKKSARVHISDIVIKLS